MLDVGASQREQRVALAELAKPGLDDQGIRGLLKSEVKYCRLKTVRGGLVRSEDDSTAVGRM